MYYKYEFLLLYSGFKEVIKITRIGYARVSTLDQSLNSQIDMLKENNCERIFSEKVSGRKERRTELDKCFDYLRSGDTLVITKLDRLGRTTKQLIELAQELEDRNIELHILDTNINTNTAMGKMFFTMMSAFAELEANLLSERTKKGLDSARARGRKGGRPPIDEETKEIVCKLYYSREYTIDDICRMTKVSKTSIYNIIKEKTNNGNKD